MITTYWIYLQRRNLKHVVPLEPDEIVLATEDGVPIADDMSFTLISDPEE